jgi:hypothetical protein
VRCLRDGVVTGAGIDIVENEPHVPPELFAMDNVVMSNHRAMRMPESIGMIDLVAGNLSAFFAGTPLLSPVTLTDRAEPSSSTMLHVKHVMECSNNGKPTVFLDGTVITTITWSCSVTAPCTCRIYIGHIVPVACVLFWKYGGVWLANVNATSNELKLHCISK